MLTLSSAPFYGSRGGLHGVSTAVEKIARGLSAGRVQSVAVRLVVEREREIKAFVPEEYWEVDASTTTPGGDALPLQVTHSGDKPFRPVSREETMAHRTERLIAAVSPAAVTSRRLASWC